ncbi:MAG: formate--tetrahydrofolate ligase [Actinomycetota bacterium]|nr:formate--tetrahydrofolate ligase [Actinomycetota bacterium]MDH5314695.1 formate--tetrahydrofolate ligase [Actinomycetota bacterium]
MKSGLEIAQEAELRPIADVAAAAGIEPDELEQYGRYRAKIDLSILDRLADRPDGKLIITTAITPTKAGEGKTTTSVSLTQGLGAIGKDVMLCLREPSMGPVWGIKGGGNGGGYAQVVPMEEFNLHFNGDFHAVSAAHNLLSAALDASVYHGNPLDIDPMTITWPRTIDMNDRELRNVVAGLGGKAHGYPRQDGFVITAASEVMAVFALASDLHDLRARLGRIVVASTNAGDPVTADDLRAGGAMTVIMKDAIKPNLVQTLEGQPVLAHAGPFGNIAHANNSIIEDRVALKLADYVVTEAGFASDLGFQKFCDIVCRFGGFAPSAAVLVTTVRATKSHGGMAFAELERQDLDALRRGTDNLSAHVDIVRRYGLPCVVSINEFPTDTPAEIELIRELALEGGAETVVVNRAFAQGGAGAVELAEAVVKACDRPNSFAFLTPEGASLTEQIEAIATRVYGADGVDYLPQATKDIARMRELGFGSVPVCMAKTHLSLSHDPLLLNRPSGFRLPVRSVVPSAGAGFVVALCGDMQRMPGLGKTPAFQGVDIDGDGRTVGLF